MLDKLRKIIIDGLSPISSTEAKFQEQIDEFVEDLVNRGTVRKEEKDSLVAQLVSAICNVNREIDKKIDETAEAILKKLPFPLLSSRERGQKKDKDSEG
jgi:polyhydroxyalkanoate synthesis regulator phasin